MAVAECTLDLSEHVVAETRDEFQIAEVSVILQVIFEDGYYVACSGLIPRARQIKGAYRGPGAGALPGKVELSPQNQCCLLPAVPGGNVQRSAHDDGV